MLSGSCHQDHAGFLDHDKGPHFGVTRWQSYTDIVVPDYVLLSDAAYKGLGTHALRFSFFSQCMYTTSSHSPTGDADLFFVRGQGLDVKFWHAGSWYSNRAKLC